MTMLLWTSQWRDMPILCQMMVKICITRAVPVEYEDSDDFCKKNCNVWLLEIDEIGMTDNTGRRKEA